MSDDRNNPLILELTADIVSAYLSNNQADVENIPPLIQRIHKTLVSLGADGPIASDRPKPAVPIAQSITPDYLICLEDGKKLKMLKRHLRSAFGMSPREYRERWGLPADYPMVAPNYAKRRSELAKEIGLGTSDNTGKD